MMMFDREIYFDQVREHVFGGSMTQKQVDGQEAILSGWELGPGRTNSDLRHLAYPLATTAHETGFEFQPIEEWGKGEGHPYGEPDPETGETYYGRGFVQLTWRDNYKRATDELGLSGDDDLEWHPSGALVPDIAAAIMFDGMAQGWFRTGDDGKPETLAKYFNDERDDPFGAREIINGDKNVVPSWAHGDSIGELIEGYHNDFLAALTAAAIEDKPQPTPDKIVTITIDVPPGVIVNVVQS